MFCQNCGARIEKDARFCGSCGGKVEDDSTAQTRIAPEKNALEWENIVAAAKSLQIRLKRAGGDKYSEILEIAPNGYLKMPTQGNDVGSLFAAFGSRSSESLIDLAKTIKENFPGFDFNFEIDPQKKWIKYTVTGGNEEILGRLCDFCGSKLDMNSKFCGKCGKPVKGPAVNQSTSDNEIAGVNRDITNKAGTTAGVQKPKTTLDKVIYVVVLIASYLLVRYVGLISFLIILFACVIGVWFPRWYLKCKNVNQKLINWIAWSNILTWFIPPIGIITGVATIGFSNVQNINKRKYMILAIIAIVLAIINATWGVIGALNK